MSDRLDVLKRLTALLEATPLTPIPGTTLPVDLTGRVWRGRRLFDAEESDTILTILEAPSQPFNDHTAEGQARNGEWILLLQGRCPDDKANPSDNAYIMANDVEIQLDKIVKLGGTTGYPVYPPEYMLGQTITSFKAGAPVISPPMEGVSSKAFFYMRLLVGLARIS